MLDQLRDFGYMHCRWMFGSYRLSHRGVFYGIISAGRLCFKTDSAARHEYERRGMGPFQPNMKQTLKHYYQVPLEA